MEKSIILSDARLRTNCHSIREDGKQRDEESKNKTAEIIYKNFKAHNTTAEIKENEMKTYIRFEFIESAEAMDLVIKHSYKILQLYQTRF